MHSDSPSSGQSYWIWPLRFSRRARRQIDRLALRLNGLIATWTRLLVCSLLIGVLPVLASVLLQIPVDRLLTTIALTPLLLATVRQDSTRRGIVLLSLVFVAHSATMIWLTAASPARVAELFPQGQAYWLESREWILTGASPEYEVAHWLPAHVMQLVGGAFFTFTSLGAVLIWEGLYQVDLMNLYVGNLVRTSSHPLIALGFGWHPWSVLRGLGFLFVGFEACSLSLERMLARPLSTRRRRQLRWAVGVGLLACDGFVKFLCLGIIRDILHSNLLPAT